MTENEKLRALLAEARAVTQDSLESNTTGFEAEDEVCKCNACERYRSIIARIDAALAEPVGVGMDPPTYACLDCGHCMHGITFTWQEGERPRSMCLKCRRNRVDAIEVAVERLVRERDEARAEIERMVQRIATLENALASISLSEYESTSSVSEKLHGHARIARKALYGKDKP